MSNAHRDISLAYLEIGQLVHLVCHKIEDIRIEQDKDPDETENYQLEEKFWFNILDKFSDAYKSFNDK